MKSVLVVIGTRPEAIKMAPLIHRLGAQPDGIELEVCVTAQHREMLDQVLETFSIVPDYDMDVMQPGQDLFDVTARVLTGFRDVLQTAKPDYVFVHGDTTTSLAASLAAYYAGASVCHVEAGLRTWNKRSPFPEEINRQLTDRITDHHFAPTTESRDNLLSERVPAENILVTGNTVVDALLDTAGDLATADEEFRHLEDLLDPDKRTILVTTHRRENFGEGIQNICKAIATLAARPDTQVILPVHPNPNVKGPVEENLGNVADIHLIEPLSYRPFVWTMLRADIICTDSGGIQEEAPSLNKPVLVMRDTTERPEAVHAGTAKLVGTDVDVIVDSVTELLDDPSLYDAVAQLDNPYGDGKASDRIVQYMLDL